nr:DMT family transporter [uncultured Actinomyces sp.]
MSNAIGYIVTVVAALCWGASGVSADYLMTSHGVELTLVSFFRMFTAGILILGCALACSRRITTQHRELVTTRRNWLPLVSYAIFGLATYTLLPARLIAAYGAELVVGYGLAIAGAGVGLVGRVWRYSITWTPDVILAMTITVVLGTAVAFTAYLWGVDCIGPVRASLVGCAEPIAATVFSVLIMGSSYTGADIVGMALIVSAVVTISVVDLIRARRVTQ